MVAQKGSAYVRSPLGFSGFTMDMLGAAVASDTQLALTASEITLDFSTVASGGIVGGVFVKNNGTTTVVTDYITLSYGTGAGAGAGSFSDKAFLTLRSGEAVYFRPMSDVIQCQSSGAIASTQISVACHEL